MLLSVVMRRFASHLSRANKVSNLFVKHETPPHRVESFGLVNENRLQRARFLNVFFLELSK